MDQLPSFPQEQNSFLSILEDPLSRKLLGHEAALEENHLSFAAGFTTKLDFLIRNPGNHLLLFKLGYTALEAFLQSNVTGPPLGFNPEDVVFPEVFHCSVPNIKRQMFASLSVQGDAIYSLTPHIELFWVAKTILNHGGLCEGFNGRRARVRVNFWHQSLLSEPSDLLRDQIDQDAEVLEARLTPRLVFQGAGAEDQFVGFLLEQAAIDVYYGNDIKARKNLAKAANLRRFDFALTGALGKRTKFQDRDISQLVVLAKSRDEEMEEPSSRRESGVVSTAHSRRSSITDLKPRKGSHAEITPLSEGKKYLGSLNPPSPKKPEIILLNDDTLLESVHFAPPKLLPEVISDETVLPPSLAGLDPSAQPLLHPFDSITLLQTASSITNTSPSDGLTREETLPYATRVLEGGSSNWQVYTQALLVRSRIEGYRSRTAERGLLQLQALVDQVILETTTTTTTTTTTGTSDRYADGASIDRLESIAPTSASPKTTQWDDRPSPSASGPSSFLPAARASESSPAEERLKYIYQLHSPLRWELEAELAARWVSMGGLKTALEIYERLQMHAEVALCLAATQNEKKAVRVIRGLLFRCCGDDEEKMHHVVGMELDELPPDAPRLFCILGDLEDSAQHYERAWALSNRRYARAQRSLGQYYTRKKNYPAAAAAYAKALEVNRLNASTWFALGCVQLKLEAFRGAVESFTRTVQLDADDAEGWSNLAAALLQLPESEEGRAQDMAETSPSAAPGDFGLDEHGLLARSSNAEAEVTSNPSRHRKDALNALRRAAQLKYDNARIWDNYLTVAASIPPPDTPWSEIIVAQKRIIAIRGKSCGEKAVDENILTVLVRFVTQEIEFSRPVVLRRAPNSNPAPREAKKGQDDADAESDHPTNTAKDEHGHGQGHGHGHGHRQEEGETAGTTTQQQLPRGSIARQLIELVDVDVTPLITASPALWLLVSDLNLWRHRPLAALEAQEKAWRCATSQPGVYENERGARGWEGVVDATIRLVRAYEELGPRGREMETQTQTETERMGALMREEDDTSAAGEEPRLALVARDWRFKASSAVKSVMGRGRETWEGTNGWKRLVQMLDNLKTTVPSGKVKKKK